MAPQRRRSTSLTALRTHSEDGGDNAATVPIAGSTDTPKAALDTVRAVDVKRRPSSCRGWRQRRPQAAGERSSTSVPGWREQGLQGARTARRSTSTAVAAPVAIFESCSSDCWIRPTTWSSHNRCGGVSRLERATHARTSSTHHFLRLEAHPWGSPGGAMPCLWLHRFAGTPLRSESIGLRRRPERRATRR